MTNNDESAPSNDEQEGDVVVSPGCDGVGSWGMCQGSWVCVGLVMVSIPGCGGVGVMCRVGDGNYGVMGCGACDGISLKS